MEMQWCSDALMQSKRDVAIWNSCEQKEKCHSSFAMFFVLISVAVAYHTFRAQFFFPIPWSFFLQYPRVVGGSPPCRLRSLFFFVDLPLEIARNYTAYGPLGHFELLREDSEWVGAGLWVLLQCDVHFGNLRTKVLSSPRRAVWYLLAPCHPLICSVLRGLRLFPIRTGGILGGLWLELY